MPSSSIRLTRPPVVAKAIGVRSVMCTSNPWGRMRVTDAVRTQGKVSTNCRRASRPSLKTLVPAWRLPVKGKPRAPKTSSRMNNSDCPPPQYCRASSTGRVREFSANMAIKTPVLNTGNRTKRRQRGVQRTRREKTARSRTSGRLLSAAEDRVIPRRVQDRPAAEGASCSSSSIVSLAMPQNALSDDLS